MPTYILCLLILVPFAWLFLWCLTRRKKSIPHKNSSPQTKGEIATVSTSTPYSGSERLYDVFLNFRGPDSRYTIADVLYRGLTNAGVRVFLDDEEIRKGEVIEGELFRAITYSKIYIPIFSKDYASSKWCLRELAKMIECWESSNGDSKKEILPIFFDVDVSDDVKLQSQLYTTALQKHKNELGEVAVKSWEDALRKVATIKGWNLRDHGLSELADLINKEIFNKLTTSEAAPGVPGHLVGIDKPVKDIMELLEEGSPGVRFIVIHGMGGIGKTTLAEAIFKKISSRFQGKCLLKDVRRSASPDDMAKLQEKLLQDTLNLKFIKVSNIDDGIDMISSRLCDQNVLIVLDDVDTRDQLLKLAARPSWFGPKSRIIITTRNIEFLPTEDSKGCCFYEMKEMVYSHALQLFCWHAFEKDCPPPGYRDISNEIVATTGGLPLALEVTGSLLYNQDYGIWKFRLEKLKKAPHEDVKETLMISYEALEYEHQQIFLDIACFFINKKKMDPIYFWEACELYPDILVKALVRRSLIKVNDEGKLWMHDQLRDLGRVIAQPQTQDLEGQILAKPSRLWSPRIALDVLRTKAIAGSILALQLGRLDDGCLFVREEFAGLENLKFLQLQGGNLEGNFQDAFKELRWLSWFNCPLKIEATNLSFKNLVVLKLSESEITEHWDGWCLITETLKVLHLRECKRLQKTPNFSAFMGLERLILKDCLELEVIDQSIRSLKNLDYLRISNDSIQAMPARPQLLPDSIGDLESLTVLKINNIGLTELHPSIGRLVNLKRLYLLRCPHLENLPSSIGNLTLLEELDISSSAVKELPNSIGDLKRLTTLRLNQTSIESLPDSISRLESLSELDLSETRITHLPETIGNLKRLKIINLSSTMIESLPKVLGEVENLEELLASRCNRMDGEIPEEIGKLSCLRILDLFNININPFATTIDQTVDLIKVPFREFDRTQEPWELQRAVDLLLWGIMNNEFHETLSQLDQTTKMDWLRKLSKMEKLRLVLPNLLLPPTDLSSLSSLRMLEITCFDPRSLTHLPSSLQILSLHDIKSPINWRLFSSLNNLSMLALSRCWLKEIKVDGPGGLKNLHLHYLSLVGCRFLERLSNLSCLKELRMLFIAKCPNLVDLQDLDKLESLRSLQIGGCNSIRQLPDLSRLKTLELLHFDFCTSLKTIPDVDEEAPCRLEVLSCKHFRDFKGPYLERHRALKTRKPRKHHGKRVNHCKTEENLAFN